MGMLFPISRRGHGLPSEIGLGGGGSSKEPGGGAGGGGGGGASQAPGGRRGWSSSRSWFFETPFIDVIADIGGRCAPA